jgi:tetratricopeptide (TPR) repeat protein
VPAAEGLRGWIAAASLEIAANPTARIVVTSEREPLPQVRKAFEPLRMAVREAPYLERVDVEHMVSAAGGDHATWAALIHLACGAGHPLLVDARVAGLASKGWPAGERLNGLGVGDGPSEIADVRREVSLRLLDELSPDAHQLLIRISGLLGSFDRRLVDAVAAVGPAIPRAGALLEYLVGPWIEQKRTDRYGLSPLLTAASTSLSEAERTKVHTAAVDDLVKRNPFPADLLSALVVYSMIVRHTAGFMFVGQAVINTPRRAELAWELFPLIYMKSGENGLLIPEHPGVSAILRTAQVMAAVNSDPPRMVEQVVAEALAEAARLPDKLRGANTLATLMAVLGNEGADLKPKVWMPMLVSYHDHMLAGRFPAEMTDLLQNVDLGPISPEQMFFMVRSNKVDTVADVEELFGELERIDPEWRRSLLRAAPTLLKGPPLFVQKGWSSETGANATLGAAAAEIAYARMADQAIAWGEEEIAIECILSRAVMLDEYLHRHEDALAVLDEADEKFGWNKRLVRSRATVLATMGRHAEGLELLSALGPGYSEDEPLERLLVLRTAAMSAAKVQQFARSAKLFHDAYAAATDEAPQVLGASVRPGLLADAAIMEIQDGRIADAVGSLLKALDLASADQSGDKSLLFAYAAITHVTQWAVAKIEGQRFLQDPSANPGVCSTLLPKFDPAQLEARKPNQELYLLTRLEAVAGLDAGAEGRLHARERFEGVQLKLAVGVGAAQMERYIGRGDAESVLALLPRYAWLSGLFVRAVGADQTHAPDRQIPPADWGETEAFAARAAVSGLLGMLVADGRVADAIEIAKRAREMSPSLGGLLHEGEDAPDEVPELFTTGLAALRLLLSDVQLNAEQLLRSSVELFMWLRCIGASNLSARAHSVLGARWLQLVQHRRAILSIPRVSVPAIESAAAGTPTIAGIARVVEAGRLGSSLGLPGHIVDMLKATK